jgi:hypothetical protein
MYVSCMRQSVCAIGSAAGLRVAFAFRPAGKLLRRPGGGAQQRGCA